jgi:hypothetical protein
MSTNAVITIISLGWVLGQGSHLLTHIMTDIKRQNSGLSQRGRLHNRLPPINDTVGT